MSMVTKEVIVVGGSITGIQTAIDLGNRGYKVYLVEASPSIGGRMAQLDKTFPTNDCSICILAPKMIEAYQHPNVVPMTYSEVAGISGTVGNFKVKVRRKSRYVDIEKCTGCGECIEKCPTKVKNEFDLDLGMRKAIYVPFPQAVPRKVTIDPVNCKMISKGKCGVCKKVCQRGAIDYELKDEIVELEVGALVICTGFDFYDMAKMPEYGYGRIRNVVTAMEFERLLNASGPTMGHLVRASDHQDPKKIAFIHCAGSRDLHHMKYCTGVCCMHSIKEAILAHEHDADVETFLFYIDLRTAGRNFYEYLQRANKDYKVNYIRSKVGKIKEDNKGNPIVVYEDMKAGGLKQMTVDMVVLAQALTVGRGSQEVGKTLGLQFDNDGFIKIPDILRKPMDTTIEGILACGFCQGPMDIPQSVAQASGAAARVMELFETQKA
jgi:heterodisulfide reductase subunit A2